MKTDSPEKLFHRAHAIGGLWPVAYERHGKQYWLFPDGWMMRQTARTLATLAPPTDARRRGRLQQVYFRKRLEVCRNEAAELRANPSNMDATAVVYRDSPTHHWRGTVAECLDSYDRVAAGCEKILAAIDAANGRAVDESDFLKNLYSESEKGD